MFLFYFITTFHARGLFCLLIINFFLFYISASLITAKAKRGSSLFRKNDTKFPRYQIKNLWNGNKHTNESFIHVSNSRNEAQLWLLLHIKVYDAIGLPLRISFSSVTLCLDCLFCCFRVYWMLWYKHRYIYISIVYFRIYQCSVKRNFIHLLQLIISVGAYERMNAYDRSNVTHEIVAAIFYSVWSQSECLIYIFIRSFFVLLFWFLFLIRMRLKAPSYHKHATCKFND